MSIQVEGSLRPEETTKSRNFFPNVLSEFIYKRTYSRWSYELGRREMWEESVRRYIEFIFQNKPIPSDIVDRIHKAILSMDVLPSMRALWSAGDAAKRDNTSMYNCSFVPVDCIPAFSEALYILMQGTGVGFSVERQFVDNLPVVAEFTGVVVPYTVEDSTRGWAEAVRFVMINLYQGRDVEVDYSQIRRKGSILKTKGGRASGPEPLRKLINFIRLVLRNASGRKLRTLECHDIMCFEAHIVVVGGVRRAAMISFSDIGDLEMRHAKDWRRGSFPKIRYLANNSSYFNSRPSEDLFWNEWEALKNSGSGERGFSIGNWKSRAPRKGELRSNPCVTGDTRVLTKDGFIQIKDFLGASKNLLIDKRFGTDGEGNTSDKGAFITGEREVFRLTTKEGYSLKLTADHRVMTTRGWVEAQDLLSGDHIHITNNGGGFGSLGSEEHGSILGWYAGDGCFTGESARLYFYHQDRDLVPYFQKAVSSLIGKEASVASYEPTSRESIESAHLLEFCPRDRNKISEVIWQGTQDCQRAYLSALFSADGCVIGSVDKGISVRLHSIKEEMLQGVQQLLLNFGIYSKIYNERMKEGIRIMPDGQGGHKAYHCQASHELVISKRVNIEKFSHLIGFMRKDKQEKLEALLDQYSRTPYQQKFLASFVGLESLGTEIVYDLTEETTHSFVANGLVIHNCHEIGLRFQRATDPWTGAGGSGQFCNLSAAVMRAHDTVETMAEKIRLATWIGAVQSSYTYFPYLRDGWKELCDEDRLLGVDITGHCDNPHLSGDKDAMTYFNAVARATADIAADTLGINRPAAVCTGKPSGNSSQLVDCASGFHTRYGKYYFRHVRISADDPLFKLVKAHGVPCFKENGEEHLPDEEVTTWVFRFPVKSPKGAVTRHHETALEQCQRYLDVMDTWCSKRGHNQSATIYVRDEEWQGVGQWLWDNFDSVVGLSFLPYDGGKYRLAPYIEIERYEYEEAVREFPDIDWSLLTVYEKEDRGQGSQEYACTSGSCEF